MFEKTITAGQITLTLRKNVRKAAFNYALALERLYESAPDKKAAFEDMERTREQAETTGADESQIRLVIARRLQATPSIATALAWRDAASNFASYVYPYVTAAAGLPFEWPTNESPAANFAEALAYLLDNPEIYDAIEEAVKELELPNGTAGAPVEQLTPVQRADPLSEPAAPVGNESFASG